MGTTKASRFYPAVKVAPDDPESAFLRVSCYLQRQEFVSPEGSVVLDGQHVRFSVWIGDEARCVLSIPSSEALELAEFMKSELSRLNSESPEPSSS